MVLTWSCINLSRLKLIRFCDFHSPNVSGAGPAGSNPGTVPAAAAAAQPVATAPSATAAAQPESAVGQPVDGQLVAEPVEGRLVAPG